MQQLEYDITIIGGGCIGSSILYELCRRHFKNVALLDHGRKTVSATTHSGGMLRVFHENPAHIELALQNALRLEAYQQTNLFTHKMKKNGHLYFFNKKRYRDYKKNINKMEKANYPFEIITAQSGKNRFSHFNWNNDWAIFEPAAGGLSPQQYADDLLTASVKQGASLYDSLEVQHILFEKNKYLLITNDISIKTEKLVLAGGARILPLLQQLNLPFSLAVKTLTTYTTNTLKSNKELPNFFDRESLHFASFSQQNIAIFSNDYCERIKEKNWINVFEKKSANDIYAPQRIGLLGKIPGFSNLFIATGWGGTAFKFALEIGHRIVNTIETGNEGKPSCIEMTGKFLQL